MTTKTQPLPVALLPTSAEPIEQCLGRGWQPPLGLVIPPADPWSKGKEFRAVNRRGRTLHALDLDKSSGTPFGRLLAAVKGIEDRAIAAKDTGRINQFLAVVMEEVPERVRRTIAWETSTADEIIKTCSPYWKNAGERQKEHVTVQLMKTFVDEAWETISPEDRAALANGVAKKLLKELGGSGLDSRVREHLFEKASLVIARELDARETQLRERIMKELDARWNAGIESVVKAQMDGILARVRAEMVKP